MILGLQAVTPASALEQYSEGTYSYLSVSWCVSSESTKKAEERDQRTTWLAFLASCVRGE